MLEKVEWGKFKLGNLFDIKNTLSFNKNKLVSGNEYDYVTRTSQNQGILQETGFVNKENINSEGIWSLGLLQMDFFYRYKPWYAGQFVRKIVPKIEITQESKLFFTLILNQQKNKLLSVLVRDIDEVFKNLEVELPKKNGEIDFDFMESFIEELEKQKIKKLNNYLEVTGLKDYNLTEKENEVLEDFENEKIEFGEYKFNDNLFNLLKVKNKLSKSDLNDLGNIPVFSSESTNNGIVGYTNKKYEFAVSDKNPIYLIFGDHTRSFNISKENFAVADNTKVLSINTNIKLNSLMYICSSWKKVIPNKGYSRHWSIAKSSFFQLPIKDNKPDYELMEILISAVQKLVIKDVVNYTNNKMS